MCASVDARGVCAFFRYRGTRPIALSQLSSPAPTIQTALIQGLGFLPPCKGASSFRFPSVLLRLGVLTSKRKRPATDRGSGGLGQPPRVDPLGSNLGQSLLIGPKLEV